MRAAKPSVMLRHLSEVVLSFKNVSFEYKQMRPIIDNATFSIDSGSKVTIMGQNGSGKSTLLKLIDGSLEPLSGTIQMKKRLAVATARQVISPDDRTKTVHEFFLKHIHGNISGIDGRIASALQTVKLDANHNRLVGSYSGGQQARLLLASALILEPDILLLDEPTNNLDTQGIQLLTEYIKTSPKTCVVISHDEAFLNSFTDSVLYLDNRTKLVEQYMGNYKNVKDEISKRIAKESKENARLTREADKKKEQANNFANKGGGAGKAAKKLRESAEQLMSNTVVVRKEDKAVRPFVIPFQSTPPEERSVGLRLGTLTALQLPEYIRNGQSIQLELPVDLSLGTRIHLKGPNGSGKTSFLESFVSRKASGVTINPRARIGYYRQDFRNLNFDMTVIECLHAASDNKHTEQHIRFTAAGFMLNGDIANQPIHTLSEGQKGLLSFACLVLEEPAVLVVDEPTNHINFRHLPIIAEGLNSFKGAIIIVSHDTSFVAKLKINEVIDLRDY